MKHLALTAAFFANCMPSMANTLVGFGDMEDIIALLGVILSLGMPIIIVLIVLWFNYKKKKMKYEVISQALASGKELPAEFYTEKDKSILTKEVLSKGIKNSCLGIGLTIMLWFMSGDMKVPSVGILIFFIGLGQIITAYATREKKKNINTPTDNHSFIE